MIRKYFLSKYDPLIKEIVSPQFKAIFGKLNCWQNIDRRRPYKNNENFVLYQNVLRKYFLSKLFVPLITWSVSPKILGNFWKIKFLMEYWQAQIIHKWWKFCIISKGAKKIFLSKFFAPLFRGSVSPQFKAIFTKLNFWRNIDRRGPYKNDENFVLSQNVLKIFLSKLLFPLIKGSVSPQLKTIYGNRIFEGISTGADLTKMVKILYNQSRDKMPLYFKTITAVNSTYINTLSVWLSK